MHFTVSCPACQTEFPVDSEKVPAEGVHAVCSACERIFLVERPQEAETAEAEDSMVIAAEVEEASATEDDRGDLSEAAVAVEEEEVEVEEPREEEVAEAEATEAQSVEEFDRFFEPVLDQDEELQAATAVEEEPELEEEAEEEPEEEGEPEAEVAPEEIEEEEEEAPKAPRFGQRDPKEKAERLARVLVQDMIAYNSDLYEKALADGTLKEDFEDEVEKSWEEYVDRIGEDMATSTTFFRDALNEILAKGEELFDGPP